MLNLNYIIADGSGLSYDNSVSARLLVNVLKYSFRKRELRNLLMRKALSVVSSDSTRCGTLHGRMLGTAAENNVHAKTETLGERATKSLAGYCTSKDGHALCIAIICNDGSTGGKKMLDRFSDFQDNFCITMCE